MEIRATVSKSIADYQDYLWIFRNGSAAQHLWIDRTCDALYWANRKEMQKCETVTCTDTGEKFDIYRNIQRNLACAIPA